MAIREVRADNIDKSLPIAKTVVTLKGKCPICKEDTSGQFRYIANEYQVVAFTRNFDCGKKDCKGRISVAGTIKMPKV